MYEGRFVFTQIMDQLPWHTFERCVRRYNGNHRVRTFSCAQQFRVMAIAQLTQRTSLRDTIICLKTHSEKLYHLGIAGGVSLSALAKANEFRNWQMHADFAQRLIGIARPLYNAEDFELQLTETVYALDSTTIDLCLSLFGWAPFRTTKAGIKVHTLLDLQGNIPTFIDITEAKTHDVHILDQLVPELGAIYVMDRAYLDFERLHRFHRLGSHFVLRAKSNTRVRRLYSHSVDRNCGLICDQTVMLTGINSARRYPDQLRHIRFKDPDTAKTFVFLTNNTHLPALTVTELYRSRWQIETFFRWIKQHLRIKTFYGHSENAVKTQIWTAVAVYVLIAIIKKRLHSSHSLYHILQIFSTALFEKTSLNQLFTDYGYKHTDRPYPNQLNLFGF